MPTNFWNTDLLAKPGHIHPTQPTREELHTALIASQLREKALISFVEDVAANWDCDEDAHRYQTDCRVCLASRLLETLRTDAFEADVLLARVKELGSALIASQLREKALRKACEQVQRWFEVEDDHSKMPEFMDRVNLCQEVAALVAHTLANACNVAPHSQIVAAQLREKKLRELLERIRHPDPTTPFEYAALSQPTNTTEADALLEKLAKAEEVIDDLTGPDIGELPTALSRIKWLEALVKELEEEKATRISRFKSIQDNVKLRTQLTAARAVIEEAEKALENIADEIQMGGYAEGHFLVWQRLSNTLTRIREWKESGE